MMFDSAVVLDALAKAVDTETLADLVPEDLEVEAHNFLWNETDPGELTLLKLMPATPATSVIHQYNRVLSYGESFQSGFFSEKSLPPETNFRTVRVSNNIRLMGEVGPTYLLAGLEKTARALGTSGGAEIERAALRKNVLWKKNRNLYFSRTDTHRLGASGPRFKGLYQLIKEGTDGTDGAASPYGAHVIDMAGDPLTVDSIRNRASIGITLFGIFNVLLMDPFSRGDLEASMDSAQRLNLPITASPYTIGQEIAGLRTQGSIIQFETDNTLTALHSKGQYGTVTETLAQGAPSTRPTVSLSVGAVGGGRTSHWDASSAGDVYYVVTEVVDELEGLGTRAPTGSSLQAVGVGQEVTLTLTPGNSLAASFKVYRGFDTDIPLTGSQAWFIFEVANSGGGGAVTAYDDNDDRPNHGTAFGLRIVSASQRAMGEAREGRYSAARDSSSAFFSMPDNPRNTIATAELGPRMGMMQLATVLPTIDRPLIYTACTPMCRNPRQQIIFKNIGRA